MKPRKKDTNETAAAIASRAGDPKPGWTRRAVLKLTAGASTATLMGSLLPAFGQSDQDPAVGNASAPMFTNPLFAGDYPDPTILRVGEDFYASYTSNTYSPGLVIWHSRDLVNWTPVAHAINDSHGGEIWAPDLIEHAGRFFIYFVMGGIQVVHADHPTGPWSAPIPLNIADIDPGHVAGPDGKRYLYTFGGKVVELRADGLSTVGPSKKVYEGWAVPQRVADGGALAGRPEADPARRILLPHLRGRAAPSGPPTSHMEVVARSRIAARAVGELAAQPAHSHLQRRRKNGGRWGTALWSLRRMTAGISFITATGKTSVPWAATCCWSRWNGPATAGRVPRWGRAAASRCPRRWAWRKGHA